MNFKEIQSIANVFNGKTPSKSEKRSNGLPILKIRDIDESGVFRGVFGSFVEPSFYEKHSKKKLRPKDTIILNAAHNSDYVGNKNALVSEELDGIIATGEWLIVRPNAANPSYVNHFLRSPVGRKKLKNCVKGIHLYPKDVARITIPLPSINGQQRIAHLLGKVEGLIAQRKQHLQQLDDLLKSVFFEMFGDPVRNEKGWKIQACDQIVVKIVSGTSYGGEDKASIEDDEFGVLKISAVTKGTLDETQFKAVKKANIKKPLRFIKKGDLLFSRANTAALVAACCVVNKDSDLLFLPDKLWALTLAGGVNIQYFNFLLKNERFRNTIRSLATGGHDSMLNISMKKFLSLDMPNPDENLQNEFASIVRKIEDVKCGYQQSLSDLEQLYGALSQKAFKGELDLTRITLDDSDEILDEPTTELEVTSEPQKIKLSAESAETVFTINDRAAFLSDKLQQAIKESEGEISAQVLLESLNLPDFKYEGDAAVETLEDYELLKKMLFESIQNGEIEQSYQEGQVHNQPRERF